MKACQVECRAMVCAKRFSPLFAALVPVDVVENWPKCEEVEELKGRHYAESHN